MFQLTRQHLAVFALAGLATLADCASAASLCVKVADPENLFLAGASVNALNLATNKLFSARTDGSGMACLSGMPEGLYSVEVGVAGFLNVRYYPVRIAPAARHELRFQLPFGENHEGPMAQEAILSGTLMHGGTPLASATICILSTETGSSVACSVTNDLGEYAFVVPTALYMVEVRLPTKVTRRSKIDLSTAGFHRNAVTVLPD